MSKFDGEKGFIKTFLLAIMALIIISYMGIDLEKAVAEPLFKKNVQYTVEAAKGLWKKLTGKGAEAINKNKLDDGLIEDIGDIEDIEVSLN